MRAVRSRDNKVTELALARIFRQQKVSGWRRRIPVTGSPDFVFLKGKLAVFVDGCFWHGCPMHCRMPKGNRADWTRKIAGNKARDRFVGRALRRQRWRVVRIWEHELTKNPQRCVVKIRKTLNANGNTQTIKRTK